MVNDSGGDLSSPGVPYKKDLEMILRVTKYDTSLRHIRTMQMYLIENNLT
jgi:hypothetical protein